MKAEFDTRVFTITENPIEIALQAWNIYTEDVSQVPVIKIDHM
jgi:hypothetical protein